LQLRSRPTTKVIDLCKWARKYDRHGPYPQGPVYRYAIGVYQIAQGMGWSGTPARHEPYAAASIHFLIACEHLDTDVYPYLPKDLKDIPTGTMLHAGWKELLYYISTGQRMISYSHHRDNKASKWKARYKPKLLGMAVGESITRLMSLIDPSKRLQAIEYAMEEMLPKAIRS